MVKCIVANKYLSPADADKVRNAWKGRHHNPIWWWRVHSHYGIKVIEVDASNEIDVLVMTKPDFDRWRRRHGKA